MSSKRITPQNSATEVQGAMPRLRFPGFAEAWRQTSIGDFFDLTEESERTSNFNKERVLTVKLYSKGVVKNERTTLTGAANYFNRKAGQFIFSKIDLLNGAFGLIPESLDGFASSSDVPAYSFKAERSPIFFANWLMSCYERLDVERTGTSSTLKRVSPNSFLALPVLVPTPAEQQKIADCLSSLDALIAAEGQKLEALRENKQGLMEVLLPDEGDTVPLLRFPNFSDAEEWAEERLEALAKRGSGHTPSKAHPEYYGGGIKWVSLADSKRLDAGLIEETATEISAAGIKNSSAVLHPAGSVLVSRDAGVGKSAIMGLDMAVSQHFIVWTCKPDRLYNWFLYYSLQRKKPLFERLATGSTIKTIGLPFFVDMRLALPTLPEQKMIADCLASLDLRITVQAQRVDVLKSHKKGLMQQLFPALEEVQE